MLGYQNANFANGRKSTQITVFVIPPPPFVIPNVVRNPVGKGKRFFAYALNDKLMVNYYAWYTPNHVFRK